MDRCRCEEYREAVNKLRFYIAGTHRPDIIDNYNRTGYTVAWVKHGIDYELKSFVKPKAYRAPAQTPPQLPETRKVQQMWCPFMTHVKQHTDQVERVGDSRENSA